MASWTKKEIRRANKEKRRCKKLYDDWVDNEFNCGANKFIFAIIGNDNENVEVAAPSFQTLNDLIIYYNRDTGKYILDIDPIIGYDDDSVERLSQLLTKVKEFVSLECNVYNINSRFEDNLYTYLGDMSNYWVSDDLEDLYFKFYIFVQGYKQMIRNKKQYNKNFDKMIEDLEKIGGKN